jgi:predicted ArsR family transcriptional regulator
METKTHASDPIYKQLFWLEAWFQEPVERFAFNVEQRIVFQEISKHWGKQELIPMLNRLKDTFGDSVIEVIDIVVADCNRRDWQEIARREQSNSIDDLLRLLWKPLPELGFEFTEEHQEHGVQMHCTRCPHVEVAQKLGAEEWLYHLVCNGDPYIAEGLNPQIGFRRTKTLMQGHDCCDHFYQMTTESSEL